MTHLGGISTQLVTETTAVEEQGEHIERDVFWDRSPWNSAAWEVTEEKGSHKVLKRNGQTGRETRRVGSHQSQEKEYFKVMKVLGKDSQEDK